MRAVSSSMMAVLVVVALFWGNCFSCPQVMLQAAAHACCHPTKAPKDCPSPSLHNYVKSDAGAVQAPMVSTAAVATAAVAPIVMSEGTWLAAEYSPPDLISLHSSFRI